MKAKVITTVGSKDKFNYAHDMGADYVLDHSKPYTSIIIDITNYNGVDVVFEHIGPITWNNSLRVLNKGGRLVTCGSTTGSNNTAVGRSSLNANTTGEINTAVGT